MCIATYDVSACLAIQHIEYTAACACTHTRKHAHLFCITQYTASSPFQPPLNLLRILQKWPTQTSVPGQACWLQISNSWLLPTQGQPPKSGCGLSHWRFRRRTPYPQGTVQGCQFCHSDQLPCTASKETPIISRDWFVVYNYILLLQCYNSATYHIGETSLSKTK